MKFRFRYQKIMEHKELLKEIAERDFIDARSAHDKEVDMLRRMHVQVSDAWKTAARSRATGGSRGGELTSIDDFLDGQKLRIAEQKKVIAEKRQVMEDLHELFVTAAREYRIFEKLKEKMGERHKKALNLLDRKLTDEIVVTRAGRGGSGNAI